VEEAWTLLSSWYGLTPQNYIITSLLLAQSLVLAILAISTLRMKCFWGPYICAFAGAAPAHRDLWKSLLSKFGRPTRALVEFVRHLVLLGAIAALYASNKRAINEELDDLREFYDPDTVQLMEWISASRAEGKIKPNEAWTGSMQLLAGVKLCSGVPLTNHPHFEDTELRARTREVSEWEVKRGLRIALSLNYSLSPLLPLPAWLVTTGVTKRVRARF